MNPKKLGEHSALSSSTSESIDKIDVTTGRKMLLKVLQDKPKGSSSDIPSETMLPPAPATATATPDDLVEWKALCMESIRTSWDVNEKLKQDVAAMKSQMQALSAEKSEIQRDNTELSRTLEAEMYKFQQWKQVKQVPYEVPDEQIQQKNAEMEAELEALKSFQETNHKIMEKLSQLKTHDLSDETIKKWIEETTEKMKGGGQEKYGEFINEIFQSLTDQVISSSVIATQVSAIGCLEVTCDEMQKELDEKQGDLKAVLLTQVKQYWGLMDVAGLKYDVKAMDFDQVYAYLDHRFEEIYECMEKQQAHISHLKRLLKKCYLRLKSIEGGTATDIRWVQVIREERNMMLFVTLIAIVFTCMVLCMGMYFNGDDFYRSWVYIGNCIWTAYGEIFTWLFSLVASVCPAVPGFWF